MGTRGLFGFYYKGKYYVVYNHYDSYPSGLGVLIVKELKRAIDEGRLEEWKSLLIQIKEVNPSIPPTEEEINRLKCYSDLRVSNRKYTDWYCLLRNCQGSLEDVLKSGYIQNHIHNGIPDWEEFAYIVNFDTNKLDFHIGSKLDTSYTFDNLPDWEEDF